MNNIKLVYFEGCPNAERVKNLLHRIGAPFKEIRQDDLSPTDPLRGYTSPTILEWDKVIFGTSTAGGLGGCSLDIPPEAELKKKLRL